MSRDISGNKNPFFGRRHSPETLKKISESRKGKALGNQNAKGYRHTPEEIAKISAASKQLWAQRFENPSLLRFKAMMPERFQGIRGRVRIAEWTKKQRHEWRDDHCAWCQSTQRLELDHIIPRYLGGKRVRTNAQTLCASCNRWKHEHVDTPQWLALQAKQGANS